MQKSKATLVAITASCIAIAGLAYLLPVAGNQVAWAAQSRAAVGILISSLSLGAAWWFLTALSSFTKNLRAAYRMLLSGVVLFGVGLLQLPILGVFNLWNTWYVFWGVILVPFLVAIVLMYLGLHTFGRILSIRSHLMSWRMLGAMAALLSAVFIPLAHFLTRFPAEGLEVYDAVLMCSLTGFIFCAGLAFRIQQQIGEAYKNAMYWMKISMIAYGIATFHEYLVNIVLDPNGPYATTGAELLVFAVAGFIFLEAARRFYLLTVPAIAQVASALSAEKISDQDYVDSIVQVAMLVSRPGDVDASLDILRRITASHNNKSSIQENFSSSDRERLIDVYHQLESYLTTKEPVRQLTSTEIRNHTTAAFRALLAQR